MGHRLTKIYTRTGDDGTTGLANGSRIPKDDSLLHAMGDVDELNSQLAVLRSHISGQLAQPVTIIQNELFNIGAELAMGECFIQPLHVDWLEQSLDDLNTGLPPLKEFILPGGGLAASHCHIARAICRRAERTLVGVNREKALNKCLMAYLNRLSDFLFVLARVISKAAGEKEVYWQSDRLKQGN